MINYFEHVQRTHSSLILSATAGTRYFAAVAVLNTYVVHNVNDLDVAYCT